MQSSERQTTCLMRKRVHQAINLSSDIALFPKPIILQNWPKLASSTFFQAYVNGRRSERFRVEPQIRPTRCSNQVSWSVTAHISSPLAKRFIALLFRQQFDHNTKQYYMKRNLCLIFHMNVSSAEHQIIIHVIHICT